MSYPAHQVVDTDAEGRLCLADSLVYAESLGVEAVVDIATLTGATLTALGEGIGGLYSPDERLTRSVIQAAQDAGVCSTLLIWFVSTFDM